MPTMSQNKDHVTTGPVGPDGIIRCYTHGMVALRRTSHTGKNPNREFYCCAVPMNSTDPTRCNFFFWVDDPAVLGGRVLDPHATPPSSPLSSQTGAVSPSQSISEQVKQTRLESIQAALGQDSTSYPGPPSTPQRRKSSIPYGMLTPPQTQSPLTPGGKRKRDEEIARALSQTPSKKTRGLGVTWADSTENSEDTADLGGLLGAPLFPPTPPSTAPGPTTGPSGAPQVTLNSVDDTNAKGKARERTAEEDDPFVDSGFATPANSQLRVANSGPSRVASPEEISSLIERIVDIFPTYFDKIQRELVAAQKSCEAKAQRIRQLETEMQSLADENGELKSKLAILKSHLS